MALEEIWGDGSGATQALTVNYVAGPTLKMDSACDLICRAEVSVALCTRVEFLVRMRSQGGGASDWITLAVEEANGATRSYSAKPFAVDGSIAADKPLFFHVPGSDGRFNTQCEVQLLARRVGGGPTTALYVEGERRYNRDSPSMSLTAR